MGKRKAGQKIKGQIDQKARAKADNENDQQQPDYIDVDDQGRVFVTTTRGVRVECLGIALALQAQEERIRASLEWPEQPTYILTDAAGSQLVYPHTTETIKTASEEEKEEWLTYQASLAVVEAEFKALTVTARVKKLAASGIRVGDGLLKEWRDRAEWEGTPLPDDPREEMSYFLQAEIVGHPVEDSKRLMLGVYRASALDDQRLTEIEAFFRDQVGPSAEGDTAAGDQEDAPAEKPGDEAVVVEQPVAEPGGSDEALEQGPDPVGESAAANAGADGGLSEGQGHDEGVGDPG